MTESQAGKTPPVKLHAPTQAEIAAMKKHKAILVDLVTNKGTIKLELDAKAAPIATTNFVNLVKAGFYNGMPFHRVEPGFVIQAGDPKMVKLPPVGYTIKDETSPIKHKRGVIAMARLYNAGKMLPNSATTQFYITLDETPHLDKAGFTAFGRVTKGMDVVNRIAVGDRIMKATVTTKGA